MCFSGAVYSHFLCVWFCSSTKEKWKPAYWKGQETLFEKLAAKHQFSGVRRTQCLRGLGCQDPPAPRSTGAEVELCGSWETFASLERQIGVGLTLLQRQDYTKHNLITVESLSESACIYLHFVLKSTFTQDSSTSDYGVSLQGLLNDRPREARIEIRIKFQVLGQHCSLLGGVFNTVKSNFQIIPHPSGMNSVKADSSEEEAAKTELPQHRVHGGPALASLGPAPLGCGGRQSPRDRRARG